jgi:hypothetical protein
MVFSLAAGAQELSSKQPSSDAECLRIIDAAHKAASFSGGASKDTSFVRGAAKGASFVRGAPKDSSLIRQARTCAATMDSIMHKAPLREMNLEIKRLADLPWFIPEYSDEQYLSDGRGGLGPMAHIFPSPYLASYTREDQIIENDTLGILAALVFVDRNPGDTLPDTYKNLSLLFGLNCVYLRDVAIASSTDRWSARIAHPGNGKACERTNYAIGMVSAPLAVKRDTSAGALAADYPPAARFSEGTHEVPLFGFRCLDGWCNVLPAGTTATLAPTNTVNTKEGHIKGWHDEQRLTERVNGKLVPSIRASVVPVPGLGALKTSDFVGWVKVAIIDIEENVPQSSKYYGWGLRRGHNELEINGTGGRWIARVTAKGVLSTGRSAGPGQYLGTDLTKPTEWLIVAREKHFDLAVPGTARWRLTVLDDGVWVPCGQACCQAEGPIM